MHSHAHGNKSRAPEVAQASSFRSGCPHQSIDDVDPDRQTQFSALADGAARGHPKFQGIVTGPVRHALPGCQIRLPAKGTRNDGPIGSTASLHRILTDSRTSVRGGGGWTDRA